MAVASIALAVLLWLALPCKAQQTPDPVVAPKVAPKAALAASASQQSAPSMSAWNRLTPMQQQALKPLAASWQSISEPQRLKWLAISKNYPSLPPAEQATMHGRMNEWVALSPAQRAEARLNFAKTNELSKQLTPDEKLSKWQAYQALSPAEKENLASKAGPKPVGAALAVRPVAPQKLVGVAPHARASATVQAPAVKPASAALDATSNR